MGVTLLLKIIYIFVDIKIIVACSAHICKQATITVSKEMLQTPVDIFHSKNMASYVSMKKLQKMDFCPWSHKKGMMFWQVGICKPLLTGQSSLQERALCRRPLCFVTNLKTRHRHALLISGPSTLFKSFDHTIPCLICWFFPYIQEVEMKNN